MDIITSMQKVEIDSTHKSALPRVSIAVLGKLVAVDDAHESARFDLTIQTHYSDLNAVKPDPAAPDEFGTVNVGLEGELDTTTLFKPSIVVDDMLDQLHDHWLQVIQVNTYRGEVLCSYRNTITIKQRMKFRRFPLDRQVFKVTVRSFNSNLVPFTEEMLNKLNLRHFPNNAPFEGTCDIGQWRLKDLLVLTQNGESETSGLASFTMG